MGAEGSRWSRHRRAFQTPSSNRPGGSPDDGGRNGKRAAVDDLGDALCKCASPFARIAGRKGPQQDWGHEPWSTPQHLELGYADTESYQSEKRGSFGNQAGKRPTLEEQEHQAGDSTGQRCARGDEDGVEKPGHGLLASPLGFVPVFVNRKPSKRGPSRAGTYARRRAACNDLSVERNFFGFSVGQTATG